MPYQLRFVQRFAIHHEDAFLELEHQFATLEEQYKEFPRGRRYRPISGREPVNTLVWECDFVTLEELQEAHRFLMHDDRHEDLFKIQAKYITEAYTEIYQPYV